ncbi:MAG TPA: AgmX/PglI C-terminal domain-containing protein, partial [Haliangium sp.]|nr:AgmX/PglI C-terminal domain-containing protein [Haliangium sp.]
AAPGAAEDAAEDATEDAAGDASGDAAPGVAAAAEDAAEDAALSPRERRRRKRERRRQESSPRRDAESAVAAGTDADASARKPDQPSASDRVTPGAGETAPVVADKATPRERPAPEAGRVDIEATRRVVRAHLGEIRTCHERGRMDAPDLDGRVVVRIAIGRGGRVTSAAIASSTLNTPAVEKCITSAVQKWTFPAPSGGGTAVIEYPFVLR